MVTVILWLSIAIVIITSILSVVFSFKSRRSSDLRLRGLYAANMNINLGLMLIFLAIIQMFMFSGSSLRVAVGAIFLLLGIFNTFAGSRNRSHFSRM
ncbi:MAG: YtpI family protein [Candidatus Cohnella colombiensis]|uniref:YtpI family protein n=1 Tax=Candidatus Cohnella colombiensis TaxID=3121368 RepID=A0AA95ETR6_9BACL|nr:MAG: YtpI family protein [Cohnella sp.]